MCVYLFVGSRILWLRSFITFELYMYIVRVYIYIIDMCVRFFSTLSFQHSTYSLLTLIFTHTFKWMVKHYVFFPLVNFIIIALSAYHIIVWDKLMRYYSVEKYRLLCCVSKWAYFYTKEPAHITSIDKNHPYTFSVSLCVCAFVSE